MTGISRDLARGERHGEAREDGRPAADLLDATFASMNQGVMVYGPGGEVLRMNAAAERILGVSFAEWAAAAGPGARAALVRLQTPQGAPVSFQDTPIWQALRGEQPRDVELLLYKPRGDATWVSASAAPIRGANGEIQGAVATFSDVTEQKRALQALSESDARFRAVFQHATDAILVTDPQGPGRVLMVNPAACRLFGYPEEEFLRLDRAAILDLGDPHVRALLQARDRAGRGVAELKYRRKDGSSFTGEFASAFFADRDGHRRAVAVIRDVTDRTQAELKLRESEERARLRAAELQAVLDTVPAAVWIARDPTGEYIEANRFGAELLRRDRGSNVSLTSPAGDRPRNFTVLWNGVPLGGHDLPIQRAARTGEEIRDAELDFVFDDGTVWHLLGNAAPILDGEGRPKGSVGAFIDITRRKRAEQDAQESDRRKTEFLAILSHELRNPLAPIRTSIYLLERAAPGSEQAARALEVLRRQADHITRLVDDLLDVTRISRGKVSLHRGRVDLAELVSVIADDQRFLFERAGVALRVHPAAAVWVDADATRIAQVLANLLQNAVKFTPAGGTVDVLLGTGEGWAELTVRDTGVGIEPDQVERMFEPFAQVDQGAARTQGGLGLGLALAKSIVELHGGEMRAHSDGLGHGAEFVVALPLADSR